jgi:hypothetical protein
MLLLRACNLAHTGGRGTAIVLPAFFVVAVAMTAGCRETPSVGTSPDPAACRFDVAPSAQLVELLGASGRVTVATQTGCTWTATTDVGWIMLMPPVTGSGSGTVNYTVAGNTSIGASARTGSLIIGGQTSTIFTQLANGTPCTYALDPASQTIGAAAGAGAPIGVSATRLCRWTATSDAPWITITSGASGAGNGVVAFSVAANAGAARTGTLTIAGRTVAISQTADGVAVPQPQPSPIACPYSISPFSNGESWIGGTSTIAVTTAGSCTWTAASNDAWITIVSGASGTGNGQVIYSVAANFTGAARTGTLTIAGLTFTIPQGQFGPLPQPR